MTQVHPLAYDIDKNVGEVGDLILFPIYSNLSKCIILGFTQHGMYVSCKRTTIQYTSGGSYTYVNSNDCEYITHDSKIYKAYLRYKIIEKNVEIPEQLRKFIKIRHKMNGAV